MWLGHDLGWWSFICSVSALVLVIPMGVLVNVITPKLLNWWAERSTASTLKRIVALEKQLSNYEAFYAELSDVENWTLKGIEALGVLGSVGLLFICLDGIALATIYKPPQSFLWRFPLPLEDLCLMGMIIATFFLYSIFLEMARYRKKRSPEVRRNLKLSIEKLKSRVHITL